MSYTEKRKLKMLYKKWLPKNYATLIATKTKFTAKWIREVRNQKAQNSDIESELLKMVNSAIRKNERRKRKIREYAKR